MLTKDSRLRPSVKELLRNPIIMEKLNKFKLENFKRDSIKIGKLMDTIEMP